MRRRIVSIGGSPAGACWRKMRARVSTWAKMRGARDGFSRLCVVLSAGVEPRGIEDARAMREGPTREAPDVKRATSWVAQVILVGALRPRGRRTLVSKVGTRGRTAGRWQARLRGSVAGDSGGEFQQDHHRHKRATANHTLRGLRAAVGDRGWG
jgi:hypothetical protein